MKDYYKILGISKTATDKEIKKAYRKLALKYHPDKNTSAKAENLFIEITEAYQMLSDPVKRQRYDRISGRKSSKETSHSKSYSRQTAYEEWAKYQAKNAYTKARRDAKMGYKSYKKQAFKKDYYSRLIELTAAISIILTAAGLYYTANVYAVERYIEDERQKPHSYYILDLISQQEEAIYLRNLLLLLALAVSICLFFLWLYEKKKK